MDIKLKQSRNKKSKPRFNLEWKEDKKKARLIYLIYRYMKDQDGNHVKLKYCTSEKVYPKNFDKQLQRVKSGNHLNEKEADRINDKLSLIASTCLSVVKKNPRITVDKFKNELDYETGEKKRPRSKADYTLLEYFQLFINRSTKHQRTIQKYESIKNYVKDYEAFKNNGAITFDLINAEFSEQLAKFLYKTKEHSQNTMNKTLRVLKQVVRDAHENGYHANTMYQSRKFGVSRILTSKHFLELEELDVLRNSDKIIKGKHKLTRDLWLIGAYTGLRISDLHRLDHKKHFSKIDEVEVIELNTFKGRTTKGNTRVVIPVLPQLKSILKRLKHKIPKAYTEQKMNVYIKEVLELAEINRMVEVKKSKSGKIEISEKPIHTQITNHSSRYTFINIMLNNYDIPPMELKKITGQTLSTLDGYERGDKKKNAIKVYAKTIEAMNKGKLKIVS